jgi:hypothetical protein|nr:hypothetical protein [Acinetobacter calcoaceticus]
MIIHLLQHIIFTIIALVIIALVIQMIVHHHLQIREDVMGAVVVEIKKALLFKGLLINLR